MAQAACPTALHLHIDRQRQKHRAGRRREGGLHGAADGGGQVLNALDFARPFGPGPGDLDHLAVEDRLLEHQPAVLLAGGDQQRRAFAIGVVEHAHRVAQAAGDVQVDDAQPPRGHREAVGHRHHGHFLQAEDVLKAAVADQRVVERHLGRAGIAENVPHAELGEQVQESVNAGRGHQPIVTWATRSASRGITRRDGGESVVD